MTDPAGTQKSSLSTDLDYDREGIQTGTLRLPHSHNRDAYGHIPIPLMIAKHGAGPTVLLTGANHGDEYEGSVALMHLMHELSDARRLDSLRGRLFIIPGLNFPAYLNGTRTSPIDLGNLNRLFPGNPNGTPTEMLAHYIESELMPRADYVFDFHAGGSTMNYLPMLFVNRPVDVAGQRTADMLIEAFGAERMLYMDNLGSDRMIGAVARKHGAFFATGEFGGHGMVSLDGLAVVKRGIAGVLAALDVLPPSAPLATAAPTKRYTFAAEHYIFAPVPGIFEPAYRLGDQIAAGQLAGLIHDPYRPWAEPERVLFKASGLAVNLRTAARVDAGNCLGHLAHEES